MKYETFKQAVAQRLECDIPDPKQITVHQILKNNGLLLDGLVIMEGDLNISPTLYLNYYYDSYQSGATFQQVYEAILANYRENKPRQNVDTRFYTNFENVRPRIAFKLISKKQNAVILKDIPHIDFLDLSVVFYCIVPMDIKNGNATILIHNSHLSYWKITEKELYGIAKENTPLLLPARLRNMNEVLEELSKKQTAGLPVSLKDDLYPMFVLTNHMNLCGAACILYDGLLKQFSEQSDTDFYILPSSIHEVILIPANGENCSDELSAMVKEVNETQLAEEEILSDHAYYYSARQDRILLPGEEI